MDKKKVVIIVVALAVVLVVLLSALGKLSFGTKDNNSSEQTVAPSDETEEIIETEAQKETEEVSSEPEYELERDTAGATTLEPTVEEKQEQKENPTEQEEQKENITVPEEEGSEETDYTEAPPTNNKVPNDWETDERG